MFNNKIIIVTTFVLITLTGCNMFDEKTYVCKSNIDIKKDFLGWSVHKDSILALRIKDDSINLSGHSFILGDNIKLCKKGSKKYISEDEYSFSNDGCSNDKKISNKKVIFGTFNLITQNLVIEFYEIKKENINDNERESSYTEWKCEIKKDS